MNAKLLNIIALGLILTFSPLHEIAADTPKKAESSSAVVWPNLGKSGAAQKSGAATPATSRGIETDPTLTYQGDFKIDALTALNSVVRLPGMTPKSAGSDLEMKILRDGYDGHLDQESFAEAALVVAGIKDDEQRQYFLFQLTQWTEEAKKAIGKSKTPELKAIKLARYLQKGPLNAGYVSGQYKFANLLNTGNYNCVSSAILFCLVGEKLGLEVGTVEIPRHIFCRMEGIDIEPTSGRVYPDSIRNDRVKKTREKKDDEKGKPYANRLFRESNNLCLLSEVYSDDAMKLEADKHYRSAIMKYFKSAILDPGHPYINSNLHDSFGKWFKLAMKNRDYREASTIASFYRQILRNPAKADSMFKELNRVRR